MLNLGSEVCDGSADWFGYLLEQRRPSPVVVGDDNLRP